MLYVQNSVVTRIGSQITKDCLMLILFHWPMNQHATTVKTRMKQRPCLRLVANQTFHLGSGKSDHANNYGPLSPSLMENLHNKSGQF